jgi:adenosylcobyric acid synthase
LLPVETRFADAKLTVQQRGRAMGRPGLLSKAEGLEIGGYEIRMGRVSGQVRPLFDLVGGTLEGCTSEDGWVAGTSVHGTLEQAEFRRALLESLAERAGLTLPAPAEWRDPFDRIADLLEQSIDLGRLDRLIGLDSLALQR